MCVSGRAYTIFPTCFCDGSTRDGRDAETLRRWDLETAGRPDSGTSGPWDIEISAAGRADIERRVRAEIHDTAKFPHNLSTFSGVLCKIYDVPAILCNFRNSGKFFSSLFSRVAFFLAKFRKICSKNARFAEKSANFRKIELKILENQRKIAK